MQFKMRFDSKPLLILFFIGKISFPKLVFAMTLSGPITTNDLIVSGSVTVSSMTVSTLTVTDHLNLNVSVPEVKGRVLEMAFSSSTLTTNVTTTTWTAVSGVSGTIALDRPNNYVRISLTGVLRNQVTVVGPTTQPCYITIFRDSTTNLGDSTSGLMANKWSSGVTPTNLGAVPVGITIMDSPGDTLPHTYQPYIRASTGGEANFPNYTSLASEPGSLLLEEISQ